MYSFPCDKRRQETTRDDKKRSFPTGEKKRKNQKCFARYNGVSLANLVPKKTSNLFFKKRHREEKKDEIKNNKKNQRCFARYQVFIFSRFYLFKGVFFQGIPSLYLFKQIKMFKVKKSKGDQRDEISLLDVRWSCPYWNFTCN